MTHPARPATAWLAAAILGATLTGCASTKAINAASQGDLATLQALQAEGKAVDQPDLRRRTPLYQAAAAGHTDTVAFLLQAGSDINAPNESAQFTALIAAVRGGHADTVALLLDAGATVDQPDRNGDTPLVFALAANQDAIAAQLLAAGADPAQEDSTGNPLLYRAALANQTTMMQQLLDAGANPNQAPAASQRTPLMAAAAHDDRAAVELLLIAGANPNLQDSAGHTALHVAVQQQHLALMESLLAAGGHPDGSDKAPLLSMALKHSQFDIGALLLAAGASANPPINATYSQPLLYAAKENNTDMVALLLAAGAEVDSKSTAGFTNLYEAAFNGAMGTLDQLLAAGADINSLNGKGPFTPLMAAADKGHKQIVVRLLAAGADPNLTTTDGYNALYYATGHNAGEMVTLLLAGGADPNLRTGQYRWTPVHRAAHNGHYEVLETLLKMGGNPNLLDTDGDSPMDLALYKGFTTTPQILAQYGGYTNNYTGPKKSGGENFMRAFATVAIGAAALQADLPSHHTADIMSASIRDIWVEDGQGTNLAQLQSQYASGDFQIRDPVVREMFSASLEAEETHRRMQAQLAEAQAAQRQQQAAQQQALHARQQALAAEQQQRAQQLAAQQQQRAQQTALASNTPASATPRPAQPAPASPPSVQPTANSASIQRGRMPAATDVDCDCEGTITRQHLTVGSCQIAHITVAYQIGVFFGEPTVNGNFRWEAGANTPADCLPYNFNAWVKLQNDQAYGYVKIDPTVPKAGDTGFNVTGSPNWDNFICGFQGTSKSGCFSAEEAKQLFRRGRVTDVLFSLR